MKIILLVLCLLLSNSALTMFALPRLANQRFIRAVHCDQLRVGVKASQMVESNIKKLTKISERDYPIVREVFSAIERNTNQWRIDASFTYREIIKARKRDGENFSFAPLKTFLELIQLQLKTPYGLFDNRRSSSGTGYFDPALSREQVARFKKRVHGLIEENAPYYKSWDFIFDYLRVANSAQISYDERVHSLLDDPQVVLFPTWEEFDSELLVHLSPVPVYPIGISLSTRQRDNMCAYSFAIHDILHGEAKYRRRDGALLHQNPYESIFGFPTVNGDDQQFDIDRSSFFIKSIMHSLHSKALSQEQIRAVHNMLAIIFHEQQALTYPSKEQVKLMLQHLRDSDQLEKIMPHLTGFMDFSLMDREKILRPSDRHMLNSILELLLSLVSEFEEGSWVKSGDE